MMTGLLTFILGGAGAVWWPGIEVDAPPPGGGDPWWWRVGIIIVGGLTASVVTQVTPAFAEPMPGVVAALAAGAFGAGVVRAFKGSLVKR